MGLLEGKDLFLEGKGTFGRQGFILGRQVGTWKARIILGRQGATWIGLLGTLSDQVGSARTLASWRHILRLTGLCEEGPDHRPKD